MPKRADETKAQYVLRQAKQDTSIKSSDHKARLAFSIVMVAVGIIVVLMKYFAAILVFNGPVVWTQIEAILVLVLIVGGISIMFTQTVVAILKIIWPWGAKSNGK